MTFLHKAKGINIPDQRHGLPNEESVQDERLQELWFGAIDLIYLILLSYMNNTRGRSQKHCDFNLRNLYQRDSRESAAFFNVPQNNLEIDAFFDSPRDSDHVRRLTAIVTATRDAFFCKKARRLAAVYRSTFQTASSPVNNLSSATVVDEINRIQKEYPGENVRDVALREFFAHSRSVALERVPEFKGNAWYAELPDFETLMHILRKLPQCRTSGSSAARSRPDARGQM
jgi:hypothetical protein